MDEKPFGLRELTPTQRREFEDHWWTKSRRSYGEGDSVTGWQCAGLAASAVVERATRAGINLPDTAVQSDVSMDEAAALNEYLNSCVPANGWGYPLHPRLQGLTYPKRGVHRMAPADRLAHEEEMLSWVAYAVANGLTDAQSMSLSRYL